jgi:hypothetical protein
LGLASAPTEDILLECYPTVTRRWPVPLGLASAPTEGLISSSHALVQVRNDGFH